MSLIITNKKSHDIVSKQNLNMDFLLQLNEQELVILRKAVKKVHMSYYPEELLTDEMADMLICKLGPETMENLLKKAVDSGVFN